MSNRVRIHRQNTGKMPVPRQVAARLSNQGCKAFEAGELERAEVLFREAVRNDPHLYESWQNLGSTLIESGRLDEGLECQGRAIILDPTRQAAYLAKAVAYRLQGNLDASMEAVSDCLARGGGDDARLHHAHLLLLQGRYAEGWAEHERARASGVNPAWRDKLLESPIVGAYGRPPLPCRVLLLSEQGFGDDLQFIRYARLVKAAGATVIVGAKPPLARLFSGLPEVDEVAPFNESPPEFDLFCPLMRLPYVFGTTIETVPDAVPYLHPHPEDVEYWREQLLPLTPHASPITTHPSPAVGLCWHGSARPHDPRANRIDRRRSMTLDQLAPLAEIPGITWVSLQKGEESSVVGADGRPPLLITPHSSLLTPHHLVDFADTAALIANLDLVISVDTAVCHLAGALGKPVWMLSRFDGCWRWLTDRTDTPWYPTMTIYRQPTPGDWSSVVTKVASDLSFYRFTDSPLHRFTNTQRSAA